MQNDIIPQWSPLLKHASSNYVKNLCKKKNTTIASRPLFIEQAYNKIKNAPKIYMLRMKHEWGFNGFDVLIILLVFSLSGMASLTIKPFLQPILPPRQSGAMAIIINVIVFSVTYYLVLIALGTAFGKKNFSFLWREDPYNALNI